MGLPLDTKGFPFLKNSYLVKKNFRNGIIKTTRYVIFNNNVELNTWVIKKIGFGTTNWKIPCKASAILSVNVIITTNAKNKGTGVLGTCLKIV